MPLPLPAIRLPRRVPAMGAPAQPPRPASPRWVDAVVLCLLAAVAYGILRAAVEWRAPIERGAVVELSPRHLPWYAGLSTLRMALAYIVALAFSLVYARVAAASRTAERFMIPLLDILNFHP